MNRFKYFLYTLLVAALVFPLYRFCHRQTDGFTPRKIRAAFVNNESIPHLSSSPTTSQTESIKKILNQPLKYIGRGGQCYAFATSDEQYVIKFLKYNNNYPKIWFRLFSFPLGLETYRQQLISNKNEKLKTEYESYRIALQDLRRETGILYVHLDKGTLSNVQLELFDKINVRHILPADSFQFYIQKKGTPFYPKLLELVTSGKLEEAKKALDELSSYLINRCQKKITDKDAGIWRNFAFYKNHPFQIDIGQFSLDDSLVSEENYTQNLLSFTRGFRAWLENLNPSLAEHFNQSLVLSESNQ